MIKLLRKCLLIVLFFPCILLADENTHNNSSFVALNSGSISYFEPDIKTNVHGIEYRNKARLKWNIIPAVGYMWSNQHSKYIYVDLKHDWNFKTKWFLTTSLGAGIFHNTHELNLGHPVEFRTGLEVSYELKMGYRLGLTAYHISNSKLSNKNPGTEILVFTIILPLKPFK